MDQKAGDYTAGLQHLPDSTTQTRGANRIRPAACDTLRTLNILRRRPER